MEHTITLKKLAYGERPITCFSYCFSTHEIYLPNYEDLRPAHKETIFERITNDPANLVNSLTHEILHGWLYENLDKNTSLRFDNIDKNTLENHYLISSLTSDCPKSEMFIKRGVYYILRTVIK